MEDKNEMRCFYEIVELAETLSEKLDMMAEIESKFSWKRSQQLEYMSWDIGKIGNDFKNMGFPL